MHMYDWRDAQGESGTKNNSGGELKNINISLAENGFEVECRFGAPKSKKKDAPIDYESLTKRYVFKSAKEAAAFVADKLS